MKAHEAFLDGGGDSRVRRNVNMLNANLVELDHRRRRHDVAAARQRGAHATKPRSPTTAPRRMTPMATARTSRRSPPAAPGSTPPARRTPPASPPMPTSTTSGCSTISASGTLSDAIEGIEWVIYHAKEYNIRVLNLSLAATRPRPGRPIRCASRCAAPPPPASPWWWPPATSASRTRGSEVYGAIGSPGNDPACITVGSVNYKDTVDARRRLRQQLQLARPDARRVPRRQPACASSTTCSSPTWWRPATRSSAPPPPAPTRATRRGTTWRARTQRPGRPAGHHARPTARRR